MPEADYAKNISIRLYLCVSKNLEKLGTTVPACERFDLVKTDT